MGSNSGDQFHPRSYYLSRLGAASITPGGGGEGSGSSVSVAAAVDATTVVTITATSSSQLSNSNNNYSMMADTGRGGDVSNVHGGAADLRRSAGKAPRKRARVSKRAPTTLLNTDTHNFRAMVQQFTGGPSAHLVAGATELQQGRDSDRYINFSHQHRLIGSGRLPFGTEVMQTDDHNTPAELLPLGGDDGRGGAEAAPTTEDGSQLNFLQGFAYHTPPPPSEDRFGSLDGAYSANLEPQNPSSFFQRRW